MPGSGWYEGIHVVVTQLLKNSIVVYSMQGSGWHKGILVVVLLDRVIDAAWAALDTNAVAEHFRGVIRSCADVVDLEHRIVFKACGVAAFIFIVVNRRDQFAWLPLM